MFGATVAAAIVGVIAAITTSWGVVLGWLIWQAVYQQIENNLIQPQIQKRTVKVPPVLTVIGVLFGSSLLGILGAIIAIPAIAACIAVAEGVECVVAGSGVDLGRPGVPRGDACAGDGGCRRVRLIERSRGAQHEGWRGSSSRTVCWSRRPGSLWRMGIFRS